MPNPEDSEGEKVHYRYNAAMIRRWIIRSCFILPILLCLIGWGWSVTHSVQFWYCRNGTAYQVGTIWGSVICVESKSTSRINFWQFDSVSRNWLMPNQAWEGPNYFLGFGYYSDLSNRLLCIPFWFLILLFAIGLFFVWRRTRPRKAGAFPVIVKEHGRGA